MTTPREHLIDWLQDAHGLVPDGVIGPETLMALAARENEGPRLRRVLD